MDAHTVRKSTARVALAAALLTGVSATTFISPAAAAAPTTRAAQTTYPLPDGFRPEGIAIGRQPVAYFGSLADGDILRVDLKSGKSTVVAQGPGTPSVGLKLDDRGRLFVAGGAAGNGRIVDVHSGKTLAAFTFTKETDTFVNDVVLTRSAAYFTDSRQQQLYRVDLSTKNPGQKDVTTIPLTGDIVYTAEGNNANGIARTPDGTGLIIVQSTTGKLFRVDPASGVSKEIRVTKDGQPYLATNGDGLLRIGQTLFVVQNRMNLIAALDLHRDSATVTALITDPRFDVPTTLAVYRDRLYTPNARFTTTPTPATPYTAVSIPLP
ncbi:SMP-30/gluconolactonase/LRE family protein [Cryptosporangium phraense]|uniref:Superoxide dismutase n=1 Tax=Cryptosporangium phraense TaxID=2593070 RepID=A0A545AWX1_9ACTN|nr:SMP-30/gluconolactonase/LRE family protein [Cryptosporangium phraense]TQS45826.1 superoxide dismutase [Cryptosporangium phraense]